MVELIKKLALIDGTSGDEGAVREFILSQIKPFCKTEVDALGNIIAFRNMLRAEIFSENSGQALNILSSSLEILLSEEHLAIPLYLTFLTFL